jgi:carboxyl-terminal processing protease
MYCAENTTPQSLKGFRLSDSEYAKFSAWVKEQKFQYSDQLEKRADDLIAAAKNEKYYSELSSNLDDLKKKIVANRENDFSKFRKEISALLEMEIAFHYGLNAGQAEASIDRDPDVLEAVKTFADGPRFKKILLAQ